MLYSGTTLMQQSQGDAANVAAHLPKTPDEGCLCYVLQTVGEEEARVDIGFHTRLGGLRARERERETSLVSKQSDPV